MRLVAGQKYVRGPAGEIMPYTSGVEKINGCVVFVQKQDESDSLQLPENDNLPRFRGRRAIEKPQATETVVEKSVVTQPQVQTKKVIKSVPTQKKVFEAEFDLREEMATDLKSAPSSDDIAELD